jgi:hypothetical protein
MLFSRRTWQGSLPRNRLSPGRAPGSAYERPVGVYDSYVWFEDSRDGWIQSVTYVTGMQNKQNANTASFGRAHDEWRVMISSPSAQQGRRVACPPAARSESVLAPCGNRLTSKCGQAVYDHPCRLPAIFGSRAGESRCSCDPRSRGRPRIIESWRNS